MLEGLQAQLNEPIKPAPGGGPDDEWFILEDEVAGGEVPRRDQVAPPRGVGLHPEGRRRCVAAQASLHERRLIRAILSARLGKF